MWGRGPRGNNAACSTLCWFSVTSPTTHNQIRPFWCWFLVGGFAYILGPCGSLLLTLLWGWEFFELTPQPLQVFSVRDFEALFPNTGILGCTVCLTPQLFLPVYLHAYVGWPSPQATALPGPPATALPCVLSARLTVSTPPTSLDECFFFNSLVVGLPYSLIFCQFWLFFLFCFLNSLLSFFWLCEEAQCVYLHLHLSWKSVLLIFFQLVWLLFLLLVWLLWLGLPVLCWIRVVKMNLPVLFLVLMEMLLVFPIEYDACSGFVIYGLYYV